MTAFSLNQSKIFEAKNRLTAHPLLILNNLQTIEDLRAFMESHVYCVWDFMSLLKSLQATVAPAGGSLWVPNRAVSSQAVRLINEIVLGEECDLTPVEGEFMSHFDLYLSAMKEVDADFKSALRFVSLVEKEGITTALKADFVPAHCRTFMEKTFSFVNTGKPHVICAAFLYGRESVIPPMFRYLLQQLKINEQKAPYFHFYLDRHIHLDEDFHAPYGEKLLAELCGNDPLKLIEAEEAALDAIEARYQFWTAVEQSLGR